MVYIITFNYPEELYIYLFKSNFSDYIMDDDNIDKICKYGQIHKLNAI